MGGLCVEKFDVVEFEICVDYVTFTMKKTQGQRETLASGSATLEGKAG